MTKGLISNQTVLVTGAAGFIGFHTCIKLIKDKTPVIGFDNFNNYYDKNLKKDRIQKLKMAAEKYGVKIEIIDNREIYPPSSPNVKINDKSMSLIDSELVFKKLMELI